MPVKNIPQIALVGLPNSGKSTLFNRITKSSHAIISEKEHTTRDTNRKQAQIGNSLVEIIDTAGFTHAQDTITKATMQQLTQVLQDCDVILYIVDSTIAVHDAARVLAKAVRYAKRPTLVVANKSDKKKDVFASTEYRKLGFDTIIPVSAIHGEGYIELVEHITHCLPLASSAKQIAQPDIQVAILGRPNVGKSSLLNALAKNELAITSDIAGTTRDVNSYMLDYHKRSIAMLDTAGVRKPGKIAKGEDIEYYAKVRTQKAIDRADICLLLVDAITGVTAQDLHLLGTIKDARKGAIIVVTKWDAIEKDEHTMVEMTQELRSKMQFVWWAPMIFTSAQQKQNLQQLLKIITEVYDRLDFQLSTAKLNRFLEDANAVNPPSAIKTKKPKVNYITQTHIHPPVFTIFATHPEYMHWSYTRFLENRLREQFDLNGVPVTIEYKSKYKSGQRTRYNKK